MLRAVTPAIIGLQCDHARLPLTWGCICMVQMGKSANQPPPPARKFSHPPLGGFETFVSSRISIGEFHIFPFCCFEAAKPTKLPPLQGAA